MKNGALSIVDRSHNVVDGLCSRDDLKNDSVKGWYGGCSSARQWRGLLEEG